MTLNDAFETLETVAATSSRTEKQTLLAVALKDPIFRAVCIYAYDPFITFGIVPSLERQGQSTWGEPDTTQIFSYLDRLARREYTGKTAERCVEEMLHQLPAGAGQLLVRILNKDLRAGFTATTLNKVVKRLVPEYEPMAAHPFEVKRIKGWPVAGEPKLDGLRLQVWVDYENGEAEARSRNGLPMPTLKPLAEAFLALSCPYAKVVFDGDVATGAFNDSVARTRRKSTPVDAASMFVFDLLTQEEFTSGSLRPYLTRRSTLEDVGGIAADRLRSVVSRIEALDAEKKGLAEDIKEVFAEAKATGFEADIIRQPLRLRRMDKADRQEQEALLGLYKTALGMEDDDALGMIGHNSATGSLATDRLKAFVDRIERLEEEKRGLQEDIKDLFTEAKGVGFDSAIIRICLRLRKMDKADRQEKEAKLKLYKTAMGMTD